RSRLVPYTTLFRSSTTARWGRCPSRTWPGSAPASAAVPRSEGPAGDRPDAPPVLAGLRAARLNLAAGTIGPGTDGRARRRSLADLTANVLARLWDRATAELGDDGGIALGAVGSLGRAEAGPLSDLDLLLVHDGRTHRPDVVAQVARRLWYPVWDAGLDLDHAV